METSAELTSHLTAGAAIVYGIQWLKDAGWFPWLTADTKTVNRLVSMALAAVAALGINWAYDASIEGGDVDHSRALLGDGAACGLGSLQAVHDPATHL